MFQSNHLIAVGILTVEISKACQLSIVYVLLGRVGRVRVAKSNEGKGKIKTN